MDWMLVSIDLAAIAFFLIAVSLSISNDKIIQFASSVWWVFSIICILCIAWISVHIIGLESLALMVHLFLVGFITCFVFISLKERIKMI